MRMQSNQSSSSSRKELQLELGLDEDDTEDFLLEAAPCIAARPAPQETESRKFSRSWKGVFHYGY